MLCSKIEKNQSRLVLLNYNALNMTHLQSAYDMRHFVWDLITLPCSCIDLQSLTSAIHYIAQLRKTVLRVFYCEL